MSTTRAVANGSSHPGPGPDGPTPTDQAHAPDPDRAEVASVVEVGAVPGRLATGVAIIDGDGILRWVNEAFAELFDRSVTSLVGVSVVSLHDAGDNPYDHPDALRVVNHPPARYEFERERGGRRLLHRLSLLSGTPSSVSGDAGSTPPDNRPNGTPTSGTPTNGSGEPVGHHDNGTGNGNGTGHGAAADADAARGAAALRFVLEVTVLPERPAVGAGPVPEAAVDEHGRILVANASFGRLVGESTDRLGGRRLGELVDPADLASLGHALAATSGGVARDTTPVEIRLARGDGRPAWAEVQVVRPAGQPERLLVARDVTDRKRDELLLHEVFDSSPVPYALVGLDGSIASINPAWRARFGTLRELPERLAGLLDDDAAAELDERLAQPHAGTTHDGTLVDPGGQSTGRPSSGFELHAIATGRDGDPVAARLRATALHDLTGRLERWLVAIDDLTEHALEVEIARRNAQRVRGTLDHLDLAVVVHDAEGRVQEVNLGAHRLFGAGATDLVGERSLPRWWHPVRPDGRSLADDEHPAMVVVNGRSTTGEATIGLQLGTRQRRWFAVRARRLDDETRSRSVGAVVSYSEITELEGRLRASEAEEGGLLDAFEALPVAVYEASLDYLTTRTSGAWRRLVGEARGDEFHLHDAPGTDTVVDDLFAVIHRDDRRAAVAVLDEVAATGATVRFHHRLVGDGQHPRWVDHHVSARLDRSGRVAGFVGTVVPVPDWVAQGDRTRRLVRLVETTNDLVGEYDLQSRQVTYLNPRAIELFEADSHRLDRIEVAHLYGRDATAIFEREILPSLESVGQWEGELPMVAANGRVIQVQQWITAERDADGRLLRLVAAGHDVTDRSQREAELALRATHDALTGLPNRALLLEHVERALAGARTEGRLVALVFLDLDRFKQVNDRLGHDAGDALLVGVARRLQSVIRPGDLVARLGGDEFVILCPTVADTGEALGLADRVALAIGSAPYPLHVARTEPAAHDGVRVTASVGVALSSGSDHPEALLRDADAAMYRAKELGRSRIELFDETMRRRASTRVQLVEELRASLGTGAITVHYQPCIDLHTGRVKAVEALARWEHPERGLLEPSDFIAVAESSGLLDELGAEVLRQATGHARAWELQFGPSAPVVNVNLSSRQLADDRLPGLVRRALTDSGLRPELLCLELTESLLLEQDHTSMQTVRALKALGVTLAIDDFGTGYSSLSYLSQLPVDVVKIDRSFVTALDPDHPERAVVAAAIVTLAGALGLATIAEGVTTVAQLAELHRLGCDAAQGYYFSPALDAEGIDQYLHTHLTPVRN